MHQQDVNDFNDFIDSTSRVALCWPLRGRNGVDLTLDEVQELFTAWLREARERQCPGWTPVKFGKRFDGAKPDLLVEWP